MKKTKLILILIFILASSILIGCTNKNTNINKYGFYFDTIINIQIWGTNDDSYIDSCFAIAKEYENLLSNTIEDSDISKINNNPNTFVDCDEKTIEVLQKAIYYCKLSNGTFDITIGKISDLWNISNIAKNTTSSDNQVDASYIPEANTIASLLKDVDYNALEIKGNQVRLNNSNSKLDLGAIAKGYIADKMKEYLLSQNIESAVISLGGNILTIGSKPNGQAFKIGIQKPFALQNEYIASMDVSDQSVVSSGIYERYFKVNEKIYHHILDKQTGYPVENNLYEVTIISNESVDGDALSTIVFLLGLEKGKELIEKIADTEAVFITNEYQLIVTSGLEGKIKKSD